jgi:hypothetical protein
MRPPAWPCGRLGCARAGVSAGPTEMGLWVGVSVLQVGPGVKRKVRNGERGEWRRSAGATGVGTVTVVVGGYRAVPASFTPLTRRAKSATALRFRTCGRLYSENTILARLAYHHHLPSQWRCRGRCRDDRTCGHQAVRPPARRCSPGEGHQRTSTVLGGGAARRIP